VLCRKSPIDQSFCINPVVSLHVAFQLLNKLGITLRGNAGMLKITKIQESGRDVLLKLEGKITEQWAALLDGECRAYLRKHKAVFLDCSHIDYIDGRGVEVLLQIGGRS
jgi:hypothetical protein